MNPTLKFKIIKIALFLSGILFVVVPFPAKSQQAESNFKTFIFPDYFEISYPYTWKKSEDTSVAFNCSYSTSNSRILNVTARIRKQDTLKDYIKEVLNIYPDKTTGVIISKKVNGKNAIYFYTPADDELFIIKHLIIQFDDNTLIHFSFQFPVSGSFKSTVYDIEKSIELIGFNNYEEIIEPNPKLQTGWYFINENTGVKMKVDRNAKTYYVNPGPIVTAKNMEKVLVDYDHLGRCVLNFKFDKEGTKEWSDATAKATGKQVGFIFKGNLLCTPIVNSQITIGVASASHDLYSKSEMEIIKKEIDKEKQQK